MYQFLGLTLKFETTVKLWLGDDLVRFFELKGVMSQDETPGQRSINVKDKETEDNVVSPEESSSDLVHSWLNRNSLF
jgi:hypothetical protein